MKAVFENIRKYNTWDGIPFSIGFERKTYLEQVKRYIGSKLIKVIVGQRRAGKSYLLRQIIHLLITEYQINNKNIFYLNKEFIAFDEIDTASDLDELFLYYKAELKVEGKIYIFLDEIQNIEKWEKFVNSYSQDFSNEYELFISGSNSDLLSGELATLLSGRFVEFVVYPFSLLEFSNYHKLPLGKESFIRYLKSGGLPELLNFEDEEIKRHYIEDLKNTIVLRDIIQRKKIKDTQLLEDVFKFLITNTGNQTSFLSLVKYFKSKQRKTNYETISSYVSHLTETFVMHEVSRYDIRGKQVLSGEKKYYLNDLSFKNYIFGYYPSDMAYHLENFIYLNLKRNGFTVTIGKLAAKEIDFIAEKSDKTLYVQVTYLLNSQEVIEREFGNLLMIDDNHEKIVISMDDIQFANEKGIKHLRPWEFLNEV